LWVSAPVTKVGVSEISVNINSIINGNYRVYVANDKGVLSAASLNMVVVSMPRLYDRPAIQDFVMTLDTTLSDDNTVDLPLGGTFSVTVNWGDGTSVQTFTSDGDTSPSHTYENEGTYTIRISGALERFASDYEFEDFGWTGVNMVTTVTSFGTLGIESLVGAFQGAENLIQVPTDLPASVTDLGGMFYNASVFNQDISGWDVSNVTSMWGMFWGASVFNQNIGDWDVDNVTDMSLMFLGASVFNQDISGWDVSNVTDMWGMFWDASVFNQNIGGWDVSNVTSMWGMFSGASVFNQDISGWDVSNVTDMSYMFYNASVFNQDISDWDVSVVTDMYAMFFDAFAFDQDLSSWVVGQVTDYGSMFTNSPMEVPDDHWPNFPT